MFPFTVIKEHYQAVATKQFSMNCKSSGKRSAMYGGPREQGRLI